MDHLTGASRAAAWLAAALFCLPAAAQSPTAPATMTDVAPLPAEDRDSLGAVVLDRSLQRARTGNAFVDAARRTGLADMGRGTVRSRLQQPPQAGVAEVRETWGPNRNADGP
jgi:hypothetical protein